MLIQSDSRKPEKAMSDCQGQLPLHEQQAKMVKKIGVFSDKVFLDWPRPPPPFFGKRCSNNAIFFIKPPFFGKLCQKIAVFLIKPFWVG